MAAERADVVGRSEELDEVILAYVEAVEAGESPDRAAWLARYPDLADELAAFFAAEDQFSSLVAPIAVNTPRPARSRHSAAVVIDPPPPLAAGCVVGEYELLDEIASGGMGVVYKARHQTLGRIVALKMIRAGGLALPEDVARFRLEAEAAANLDHPNIVPIYDVGEHEGQPYFSMKYIEGGSLAQSPPTAIGGLTALMSKVARAVHYAHERGILHRDLKPANILLDRKGEPHVTDFGLATRLPSAATESGSGSPASLTLKGIAVGTPGYMAPEQAAGPKKGVTVAVDVYSLGAVLYVLLTGRPPFRADTPLETLVQVLERQPASPRSLNPAVPRDLETVCLKCLEKDPAGRYASAEALADDLERFLNGEAIAVRPASLPERFWRWCRRAPLVAALAAALVMIVAFGLLLVTFLWQRAEIHARYAEEQRQLAETKAREAALEREHAEALRHEAEENFQQAHHIVDRLCMRLSEDKLSAFPGLQPIRKEMLEAGLKYYQGFVAKRGDDPALKADLAKAYFHLGGITGLIGSRADALASYAQARATYEELLAADPTSTHYREMLAMTCINAGAVMEATDDRTGALASYERARDLLEALDRESHDTPKFIGHLAKVYNNLGNVNRGLGRLDDSRAAYDLALTNQERLIRATDPRNPGPQRELAVIYVNVAILYNHRGDRDEALRWHLKARDLQEKLYHDHRSDQEIQHDLALSCRRIGDRLVRDGRLKDGLKSLERGHELIEKLATSNGSVTEYQWELALSHRSLGHVRRSLAKQADANKDSAEANKDREKAVKSYQAAIDLLDTARRQDRSTVNYTRDLAGTRFDLAMLFASELHKPEDALRVYQPAAELYRELARTGTNADALANLAATTGNMGHLLRDLHRYDEALSAFTEAREVRERLVRLRPDDPRCRNDLAGSWFDVARVQFFMNRRGDELRSYERSREIRERLVSEFPQNVPFHYDLGMTLVNLGYTYGQTGRIEDSLATLRRAVEERRLAFTAVPQSLDYRRGLNNAYGALAEVERVKGTPSASAAALLERRELWPDNPDELYRIACEQAMTSSAVARNKKTPLSDDEKMERSLYLDHAMETLRLAVAAGFSDGERLKKEASLAPLRSREEFQKLQAGLKK